MKEKNPHLHDKRMHDFIKKHHVFTLATCVEGEAWCSNCFYAYFQEENCLVFTSDNHTRHVNEFLKNPIVAGSIVLETKIVGKIQGMQFTGNVIEPQGDFQNKVRARFLKRFPYAVITNTAMWCLYFHSIKMTDNLLGFGKKLYWEKTDK